VKELQAGIELSFAVFPESAVLFQPSEGTFDHPSFGDNGEGVEFIAFDDLDGSPQTVHYTIGEGLARVASIHQYAFDASEIRFAAVQGLQGALPIRDLSGGYGDGMGKALRVHPDMTFDAGNLLARVIALLFGTVGILYALRINDQEAGQDVAPLFLAGRANGFFLRPAPER